MKRNIAFCLVFILVVFLCGCGGSSVSTSATANPINNGNESKQDTPVENTIKESESKQEVLVDDNVI